MKSILLATLLNPLFLNLGYAGDKNYCQDEKVNREWEELIKTYPNDMNVHVLHVLRLELCFKVERGDITVEQVTKILKMQGRLLST